MTTANSITVNGVQYFIEPPELTKAKNAIGKWEWLSESVRNYRREAQVLYNNMKSNGLTFGVVEAEGYLRAMIAVEEELETIERNFDERNFKG